MTTRGFIHSESERLDSVDVRLVVEMFVAAIVAGGAAVYLLGAVRAANDGCCVSGIGVLLNAGLVASTASALAFAVRAPRRARSASAAGLEVPVALTALIPVVLASGGLVVLGGLGGQLLVLPAMAFVLLLPYLLGRGLRHVRHNLVIVLPVSIALLVVTAVVAAAMFGSAFVFSPVLLGLAGAALIWTASAGQPGTSSYQGAVIAGSCMLTVGCGALVSLFF